MLIYIFTHRPFVPPTTSNSLVVIASDVFDRSTSWITTLVYTHIAQRQRETGNAGHYHRTGPELKLCDFIAAEMNPALPPNLINPAFEELDEAAERDDVNFAKDTAFLFQCWQCKDLVCGVISVLLILTCSLPSISDSIEFCRRLECTAGEESVLADMEQSQLTDGVKPGVQSVVAGMSRPAGHDALST